MAESALRYRLQRSLDAPDGRRVRPTALDGWEARVSAVLERLGDARVVGQAFTPSVDLSSCGGATRVTDVFTWQVEDEGVASVDRASGRVTARAPGETAVLATGGRYRRLGGVRLVVKAAGP